MTSSTEALTRANDQTGRPAETQGLVFNVMRFSLHDGPGIRTTVFFKGCPLDCWWCHNPEGLRPEPEVVYFADRCLGCGDCVAVCPNQAITWNGRPVRDAQICQTSGECAAVCPAQATQIVGHWVTVEQLMRDIARDSIFFEESGGGVTFSGGEPFLQARFLEALLDACRAQRIHTVVETCGVARPSTLVRLSRKVDLFYYDLKVMETAKHRKYTGSSNETILANLQALAAQHNNIIVRMPVIPTINDDEQNAEDLARFLTAAGLFRLDLLPYHHIGTDKYVRLNRAYRLGDLKPPPAEQILAMAEAFRRRGLEVRIGG
jgi:pyruvate formate lyase activating enzyme